LSTSKSFQQAQFVFSTEFAIEARAGDYHEKEINAICFDNTPCVSDLLPHFKPRDDALDTQIVVWI